jgi:ComF family protein
LRRSEPRTPLDRLWRLLFPDRCLGCGQRDLLLCADCEKTISWLPAAVCPRCAEPSLNGRLCHRCAQRGALRLDSVRAACRYEGVPRTAILQLKFRGVRSLAPFLAELLTRELSVRPLTADLVLPVPLSPGRQRERGFNQSELLAAELSRLVGLPAPRPDLLRRVREIRPQVGLTAAERRRNVAGAFGCPEPAAISGQRVLLIDDVMTTGATLEACAAALRLAGATRVMGLVVAREG